MGRRHEFLFFLAPSRLCVTKSEVGFTQRRKDAKAPSFRCPLTSLDREEDLKVNHQNASMLALLVAQAEGQGADLVTLRALIEEASEGGAERALAALGLRDAAARRDMDELRELLRAWRDAKRSAWATVVRWATRVFLAALVAAIAVKVGLIELLRG